MRSAKLALLDAFGDAIVAQLATDAITAEVVTNPTQAGPYPYVVLLPSTESDAGSPKDSNKSDMTIHARAYSDSMTEAMQVADSIAQAVGRDVSLTLASPFYHVHTQLEANDLFREPRPEGDIHYSQLVFRMQVGHIPA